MIGVQVWLTASALDLGDGAPQFGGERAEPVSAAVAVAAFARLLQAVGGGTETNRADRLCRTLEAMRRRRQAGEIGGAPCRVDRLLGFDGAVAEFLEQVVDAGAIFTEPSLQHAAVDRNRGARGSPRRGPVAD